MRLETSLNDLEVLILKNKNDVKKAKLDVEELEKKVKDPLLTAPVKILDDDLRFFSKLFGNNKSQKGKKKTKMMSTNRGAFTSRRRGKSPKFISHQKANTSRRRRKNKSKSRQKSKTLRSNRSRAPKFSNLFKKDIKIENKKRRQKERSKSREEYFSSLEYEVIRKLAPSGAKAPKLAELRPEQYREKFRGVIPKEKIRIDSKKNIRMERESKSAKSQRRRKKQRSNSKYLTERKLEERGEMSSVLENYFEASKKRFKEKSGAVSNRLLIERRLRNMVEIRRRGRKGPRFRSTGRERRLRKMRAMLKNGVGIAGKKTVM